MSLLTEVRSSGLVNIMGSDAFLVVLESKDIELDLPDLTGINVGQGKRTTFYVRTPSGEAKSTHKVTLKTAASQTFDSGLTTLVGHVGDNISIVVSKGTPTTTRWVVG